MFALKKIVTPFLLPPGVFIVFLLGCSVYFYWKKQRLATLLFAGLGALVWLCSILPVPSALIHGLEVDYQIPKTVNGDVIILLGGGIYGNVSDMTGTGAPADLMITRIVTAVRLYNELDLPIIITGGKVYAHLPDEASIVKRFLIDLGVSDNHIIVEDRARDTFENARFTKRVCSQYNFSQPILLTSAYHLKRALIAAGFKTSRDQTFGWNDYLPGASSLKLFSIAAHEYIGILYYKLAY